MENLMGAITSGNVCFECVSLHILRFVLGLREYVNSFTRSPPRAYDTHTSDTNITLFL